MLASEQHTSWFKALLVLSECLVKISHRVAHSFPEQHQHGTWTHALQPVWQWVYHIKIYQHCPDLKILQIATVKQFKFSNKSNLEKYQDCNQSWKCKNCKRSGPNLVQIILIANFLKFSELPNLHNYQNLSKYQKPVKIVIIFKIVNKSDVKIIKIIKLINCKNVRPLTFLFEQMTPAPSSERQSPSVSWGQPICLFEWWLP